MVNDRGSVSRPPQLHCPQGLMIRLNDSMNLHTVGILRVPVQSKLMGDLQRGSGVITVVEP